MLNWEQVSDSFYRRSEDWKIQKSQNFQKSDLNSQKVPQGFFLEIEILCWFTGVLVWHFYEAFFVQ